MERNLTSEAIYQILEDEIVTLKHKPGDILSENPLCKRFQVSRTPIRSVLQHLQQNGFVQIIPHKGTIITPINLDIASQCIYQRVAVESMVLQDFISICSPTDLERVRYSYVQLQETAKKLETPGAFDINEFLSTDLSMHRIWFQATDKMYLWENLTKPQADYSRFIRLDIVDGHNVPDVLAEHQRIIELIDKKDTENIVPLLCHHFNGGVRRMGARLFSEQYKYFKTP